MRPQRKIKEGLGFILMVLVFCIGILTMVQKINITGISMSPALNDGDLVIADKLSYRFFDPSRYDMLVFQYIYGEDQYYVKRVIGLPGETVQIKDGCVWIDGKRLAENYGTEPIAEARLAAEPIQLGADEYFVLGDNRNYSSDSRDSDLANISEEQIIGKVWFRLGSIG